MLQVALVTAVLAQTPSITVTSPTASSDVVVGTTFHITWTTEVVSDVKIEYTTGSGWTTITDTVDSSQADWQSYPWMVPDEPSTTCTIRVSEYLGGSPSSESETFEIRRPALGDNSDDEGGCAAAPGSALVVLLGLAVRRRRR